MDVSQVNNTLSNQNVQGVQGHHRHKKGLGDMITDMQSAIDNAAKTGKLTSDQAAALSKQLDAIKKELSQAQASSSSQSVNSTQVANATQPSSDYRQKIRKELHEVGKQLFEAIKSSDSASSTQQSNSLDSIFKAMDVNGDGSISKDEMKSFLTNLSANGDNGSSDTFTSLSFTYSQQATMTMSQSQSGFSAVA